MKKYKILLNIISIFNYIIYDYYIDIYLTLKLENRLILLILYCIYISFRGKILL